MIKKIFNFLGIYFGKKNYIPIEDHLDRIAQKDQIISLQDYQAKILKIKIQSLREENAGLKEQLSLESEV
jgi:hypothetical protein